MKLLGLFCLARRLTRRGLRILCYHGFSLDDEHQFNSGLFMRTETFDRRMALLTRKQYPVMSLEEAVMGLSGNSLPPCPVVITFDDGFYSIYKEAVPILLDRALPATIYVTTYYCKKQNPIFRLVVQYFFWKTRKQRVDMDGLGLPISGLVSIDEVGERAKVVWTIIRYAESELEETERCNLASELGRRMDVSYDTIASSRALSIMNPSEISDASARGVDIQLHCHRHRLPEDAAPAQQEIDENRAVLAPLTDAALTHLCYPSGEWSEKHLHLLPHAGIVSATTCDPGFNYHFTPRLALRRFLDAEHISDIEFEAELCGLLELLRRIRSAAKRLCSRSPEHQPLSPPDGTAQ